MTRLPPRAAARAAARRRAKPGAGYYFADSMGLDVFAQQLVDEIGELDAARYAGGDPANWRDPLGLFPGQVGRMDPTMRAQGPSTTQSNGNIITTTGAIFGTAGAVAGGIYGGLIATGIIAHSGMTGVLAAFEMVDGLAAGAMAGLVTTGGVGLIMGAVAVAIIVNSGQPNQPGGVSLKLSPLPGSLCP